MEEPLVDRYALPAIPESWQPDSVSWKEKLFDVSEKVKGVDGFPKNLEHYYTEDQIKLIKLQDRSLKYRGLQDGDHAMVEKHVGKPFNELTRPELFAAYEALGIDPFKDIFDDPRESKRARVEDDSSDEGDRRFSSFNSPGVMEEAVL